MTPSLAMTVAEREAFLAGVHVGVLSVATDGVPLVAPVWYTYEPGGVVSVITGRTSLKARAIETAGAFALCVQTETPPYQYATVEGPVEVTEDTVEEAERRAMAHRYLGQESGDAYIAATESETAENVAFRMRPNRWRTIDYAKQFT